MIHENTKALVLRQAKESDCRFLYELRNEPTVRNNSFCTEIIPYEQHEEWFQRKIKNEDVRIFILEFNNEAIGQVRVDRDGNQGEVSYALSEGARGKGFSKWMLKEMAKNLQKEGFCQQIIAKVKAGNIASQKIFRYLGYQEEKEECGYFYSKKIPLFSVLMCTYNSAETLTKAMESVKTQEFTNWEIIVLDNGSKDLSVKVLEEYAKIDNRITCIIREDNIGWKKGLSECLAVANGEYMMFLGADDYLATNQTLKDIATEIYVHNPDIVWTGCGFAVWENGESKIVANSIPKYRVYEKIEHVSQIAEIMQTVYYNSVMHYVKIDFLEEKGIDFYEPFCGDCEGMTEALVKANKMVVLDKVSYILTTNTSQTSTRVFYDLNTERQWMSVRNVFLNDQQCEKEEILYVARRILNNIIEVCQRIVLGEEISDGLMNPIERSMAERFARLEEMIDNLAMTEMLYYAGREEHLECLLNAAGVAYWMCKRNSEISSAMRRNTKWLALFLELAMELNEGGQVAWKTYISKDSGVELLKVLSEDVNPYLYGLEQVLKETIIYEDIKIKETLEHRLYCYINNLGKNSKIL